MHFLRRRRRSQTAYHRGPLPAFFIVVALLGIFFSPLVSPALAAQDNDDPQECEAGLIFDENLGECVSDQPEQPTCADGEVLDPNSGQCVPEQPTCAEGEVLDTNTGQCLPEQPACAEGEVLDPDTGVCVPAQPQECPEGQILDPNNGECFAAPANLIRERGGEVPLCEDGEVLDRETLRCAPEKVDPNDCADGEIFNPLSGQCEAYAALTAVTRTCPLGFDAYGANLAELDANCAGISDDVKRLELTHRDPLGRETNEGGALGRYQELSGPHTMTALVPEGYGEPIVYCYLYPDEEPSQASRIPLTDGASITMNIPPGKQLSCTWFNVPSGNATFAAVEISIYVCPSDLAPDPARALSVLIASCQDPVFPTTFDLQGGGQEWPASRISGGPSASVDWNELPIDEYTVTQTAVLHAKTPRVFCTEVSGGGVSSGTVEMVVSDGNSISWLAKPGVRWSCAWFNLAAVEAGSVTITAFDCPEGATPGESLDSYRSLCTERSAGVQFRLDTTAESFTERTDANGVIEWLDVVPVGILTLTQIVPQGSGDPVWWCDAVGPPQPDGALHGTAIELGITSGGDYYSCEVFTFIDDDGSGTLIMVKYTCLDEPKLTFAPLDFQDYCPVEEDWKFTATYGGSSSTKSTNADGEVIWNDVPNGPWSVEETIPDGSPKPSVVCGNLNDSSVQGTTVTNGRIEGNLGPDEDNDVCYWFNIVASAPVFVTKYSCPDDVTPEETFDSYQSLCTERPKGVEFTLDTDLVSPTQSTSNTGAIEWHHVPVGPFNLTETVPPGYGEPVWWCASEHASEMEPVHYGESIEVLNEKNAGEYYCEVFNIPKGPGELTIYKWLCPEGYDAHATGADPQADCAEPVDGVTFTLDQPEGVDLQSSTGDSIPGAVTFGAIPAGSYVVTETIPDGIASVFVWDCVGTDIDAVHPAPLSTGNVLNIDIAGGDSIVCNWYNVPAPDPDVGQLTIYKYICAGSEFVSELDCEVYEHGAEFTVFGYFGDTVSDYSGVTDATGQLTWTDLAPGPYEVLERDDAWCHIVSDGVTADNSVAVTAGAETVVEVYNCGQEPGAQGKPPAKYPNTGVASNDATAENRDQADGPETPIITPDGTPGANACPRLTLAVGTPVTSTPIAVEERAEILATPSPIPEECERGARPVEIDIEAANVDATIEVVEVVNGVMEPPSGPEVVSWYKETARPGEAGNIVMAGHLNYWNVPEGVFFSIDELEQGDRIEIEGEDGERYAYEVTWVKQVDASEPPTAAMVGPTPEESLTLITCGGEWNAEVSEYDQRTVVRAVRVQVTEAPT